MSFYLNTSPGEYPGIAAWFAGGLKPFDFRYLIYYTFDLAISDTLMEPKWMRPIASQSPNIRSTRC